jgi:predicted GIY-YIG superfamily endonuclease
MKSPSTTIDNTPFWDTDWNEVGAVYGILSDSGQVIYIGQTNNLRERMAAHRNDSSHCMHRHSPTWVVVEVIGDEASRLQREQMLIVYFDPPCNKV